MAWQEDSFSSLLQHKACPGFMRKLESPNGTDFAHLPARPHSLHALPHKYLNIERRRQLVISSYDTFVWIYGRGHSSRSLAVSDIRQSNNRSDNFRPASRGCCSAAWSHPRRVRHCKQQPNLALPEDILRDFSRIPFVRGGCHAVLEYYLTLLRVYTSLGEIDDVTRVARILLAPFNWEIKWSEGEGLSLFKKVRKYWTGH